jgi:8-oxo-dGTP diphosphatase
VAPLGLPVELDATFDELQPPEPAAEALADLAKRGGTTVVCSQGKLMPPLLTTLTKRADVNFHTRKGAGWVLCFSDGRLVGRDKLVPLSV